MSPSRFCHNIFITGTTSLNPSPTGRGTQVERPVLLGLLRHLTRGGGDRRTRRRTELRVPRRRSGQYEGGALLGDGPEQRGDQAPARPRPRPERVDTCARTISRSTLRPLTTLPVTGTALPPFGFPGTTSPSGSLLGEGLFFDPTLLGPNGPSVPNSCFRCTGLDPGLGPRTGRRDDVPVTVFPSTRHDPSANEGCVGAV